VLLSSTWLRRAHRGVISGASIRGLASWPCGISSRFFVPHKLGGIEQAMTCAG